MNDEEVFTNVDGAYQTMVSVPDRTITCGLCRAPMPFSFPESCEKTLQGSDGSLNYCLWKCPVCDNQKVLRFEMESGALYTGPWATPSAELRKEREIYGIRLNPAGLGIGVSNEAIDAAYQADVEQVTSGARTRIALEELRAVYGEQAARAVENVLMEYGSVQTLEGEGPPIRMEKQKSLDRQERYVREENRREVRSGYSDPRFRNRGR